MPVENAPPEPVRRPAASVASIRHMQDVLSSPWRRAILYHLQRCDGPVSVDALVRRIAASGGPILAAPHRNEPRTPPLRQRLRVHVLELAEFGVVGHDPDARTVWLPDDVTVSVGPPWQRSDPSSVPGDRPSGPPVDRRRTIE